MKRFISFSVSVVIIISMMSGCMTNGISDLEDLVYIQVAGPFYTSVNPMSGRQERSFLRERKKTVDEIIRLIDKSADGMFNANDGFAKYEDNLLDALKRDEPDTDSAAAADLILYGIAAYHSLLESHEAEIKEYDRTKTGNTATKALLRYYKFESAVELFGLQNEYLEWLKTATSVACSIVSNSSERRAARLQSDSSSIFSKKIYGNLVDADIYMDGALDLYDALESMDYYASSIYLDEARRTIDDIRQGKTDSVESNEMIDALEAAVDNAMKSLKMPDYIKPIPDLTSGNIFTPHVKAAEDTLPDLGLLSDSLEYYRDTPVSSDDDYPDKEQAGESFNADLSHMTEEAQKAENPGDLVSDTFAERPSADDITTDVRQAIRTENISKIETGQMVVRGLMILNVNFAYNTAVSRISALIAGGRNISPEALENAVNLVKTELNDIIGENREEFLNILLNTSAEGIFNVFEEWRDGIGNLSEHDFTRDDLENFLTRLGYQLDIKPSESDASLAPSSSPSASPSVSSVSPSASPTPTPAATPVTDDPDEGNFSSYDVFNIAATYDTMMNLSNTLSTENLLYIIYGWSDPVDYSSYNEENKTDGNGKVTGWKYLDSSGKPVGWEAASYGETIEFKYHFPAGMESSMKVIRYGTLEQSWFFQVETEDTSTGRRTAIRLRENPAFSGDSIVYIYETENGIKDGLNTTSYNSNPTFELYIDGSVYESRTFLNGNLIREVITSYEGSSVIEHTRLFYESGVLWQEKYEQDGEEFGTYVSYNEDGVLVLSIGYKDGKYDGEYKSFFDDGTLRELITYKEGEKDGPASSYYGSEGHPLEYKGSYAENEKDGRWETFTSEGLPKTIIEYKSGLPDGEYKSFATGSTSSSSIHVFGQHSDGRKVGEWLYGYNNEGWVEKVYYDNDVKVWMEKADSNIRTYYKPDGSVDHTETKP